MTLGRCCRIAGVSWWSTPLAGAAAVHGDAPADAGESDGGGENRNTPRGETVDVSGDNDMRFSPDAAMPGVWGCSAVIRPSARKYGAGRSMAVVQQIHDGPASDERRHSGRVEGGFVRPMCHFRLRITSVRAELMIERRNRAPRCSNSNDLSSNHRGHRVPPKIPDNLARLPRHSFLFDETKEKRVTDQGGRKCAVQTANEAAPLTPPCFWFGASDTNHGRRCRV